MVSYFIVIATLIVISFAFSIISNKTVASTLPTSIFFSMTWITLNGIFTNLVIGVISLPIIGVALILVKLKNSRNKSQDLNFYLNSSFRSLVSPAVILFLVFSFLTYCLTREMQFVQWDEFTQWGFSVKAMYIFNVLGPETSTYVNNAQYVPGLASLAYSVMRIDNSWIEGNVFWAYQLILIAVIFSALDKFKWKQLHLLLFSFSILLFSSVIFFDTFMTVYADPILGLVFGYLFYLSTKKATHKNKFNFINFIIVLIAFTLIKDIAFGLALIPIFVLISNFIFDQNAKNFKDNFVTIKALKIFLIPIAVLFSTRAIWASYVGGGIRKFGGIADVSGAALADPTRRLTALNFTDPYNSKIFSLFIEKVRSAEITPWNGFSLTTVDWLMVLLFLGILQAINKKGFKPKLRSLLNSTYLQFGAGFYLILLYISYVTVFAGNNTYSFTSFERYISSYLAGSLFYFALNGVDEIKILISNETQKYSRNYFLGVSTISVVILILFTGPNFRVTTFLLKPTEFSANFRQPYVEFREKIQKAKFNQDDRVWIITQHRLGLEFYLLQYELLPAGVGAIPFSIGTPFGEGDIWTEPKMTREIWAENLKEFDYVLIFNTSESFVNEYSELFAQPITIESKGIYAVTESESGLKLNLFIE